MKMSQFVIGWATGAASVLLGLGWVVWDALPRGPFIHADVCEHRIQGAREVATADARASVQSLIGLEKRLSDEKIASMEEFIGKSCVCIGGTPK